MGERTNLNYLLVVSILWVALLSSPGAGKTIYVDDDASGLNDGTSWADAYKYLQNALVDAKFSPKPVEIRVAQGIYKPVSRTAAFQLINSVTLKGGYAGFGETDPNERDTALYQGVLSGDIGKPLDKSDNCYHVFYHPEGLNLDATAVLDGFTITGGNASSKNLPHYYGGGMYNYNSSPMLTNCTFTDNSASTNGGGMYNYYSNPIVNGCTFSVNSGGWGWGGGMWNHYSSPRVEGCTFSGNSAMRGGGMHNYDYSSPTVNKCTFSGNSAQYYGGGMENDYNSRPTITNCTFSGNSADEDAGGGMYNCESSPTVDGCTFSSNSATEYSGGGMCNYKSTPTVTNCTFSGNSADEVGGGMFNYESTPTVTNCTFSSNSAEVGGGMFNSESTPTVTNSTFSANSAEVGGGMDNSESTPTVTNCTFSANSAEVGGGMCNYKNSGLRVINCTIADNNAPNGPAMACDSSKQLYPSNVTMVNCIIWNGSNWLWNNDNSTIAITYSDVEGCWQGEGNFDKDPCFAEPGYWDPNGTPQDSNDDFWVNGDYHLKSQVGRWDPNTQSWVKDDVTSPCIDVGDPNSPIGLEPFPNGGIINMGAYGGTREASKSYFGKPPCGTPVAGDINGDCIVDFKDFALMAFHWLEEH